MMEKSTRQTSLTKFKDRLRMPPILRPQQMDDQRYTLRVVLPLLVVDNSNFSPSRLTFPLDAPYSSFSEGD